MAYQEFNLLTKTMLEDDPAKLDAKIAEFQKTHSVKFSQTHFAVGPDYRFWFAATLFYTEGTR